MKSLSVISQKGGVGKTTLSLNLSLALANLGARVTLVDCDPQGAVGHSLMGAGTTGGLVEVINKPDAVGDSLLPTRLLGLRLLPVGDVEPHLCGQFNENLADGSRLSVLLDKLATSCDLVVFDTPSGFCGATMGALRASDYAISPLQAEPVALRTLPQLLSVIGTLREEGRRIELISLVLCMLQQRVGDSLAVAEEVWSRLPPDLVSETTIPRDVGVLAASAAGVPLAMLHRSRPQPIALIFDRLAAELAPKLDLYGDDDGPLSLFA